MAPLRLTIRCRLIGRARWLSRLARREGLWAGRALHSPSRPQTRAMGQRSDGLRQLAATGALRIAHPNVVEKLIISLCSSGARFFNVRRDYASGTNKSFPRCEFRIGWLSEVGTMAALQEVGTVAALLPNCPKCGTCMLQGLSPCRRIFGDIRAFECSECDYVLILKHPFEPLLADQVVGYRRKIPFRYLLGILLAAVLAAAALRRVLLVQTEFTRIEILGGALAASAIGVFLAVVFFRRNYERRFPLH